MHSSMLGQSKDCKLREDTLYLDYLIYLACPLNLVGRSCSFLDGRATIYLAMI